MAEKLVVTLSLSVDAYNILNASAPSPRKKGEFVSQLLEENSKRAWDASGLGLLRETVNELTLHQNSTDAKVSATDAKLGAIDAKLDAIETAFVQIRYHLARLIADRQPAV